MKKLVIGSVLVLVLLFAAMGGVSAKPPDQTHVKGEYDDVVPAGALCDFPVRFTGWYNVHVTNLWDSEGQFLTGVRWQYVTHETITNEDTGKYIIGQYAGVGDEDYVRIPGQIKAIRIGLPVQFRTPHGGVLTRDAGFMIYNLPTFAVYFEAGPHPNYPDAPLCDLLD